MTIQTDLSLGHDLPSSEEELFQLDEFPLLDSADGIRLLGSEDVLRDLLTLFVNEQLPKDISAIEKAYAEKNWNSVEKLAHKMKGGAVYLGAYRMKYACQYLERYRKAGHDKLLEALYQQLLPVLDDTTQSVKIWLLQKG